MVRAVSAKAGDETIFYRWPQRVVCDQTHVGAVDGTTHGDLNAPIKSAPDMCSQHVKPATSHDCWHASCVTWYRLRIITPHQQSLLNRRQRCRLSWYVGVSWLHHRPDTVKMLKLLLTLQFSPVRHLAITANEVLGELYRSRADDMQNLGSAKTLG